RDTLFGVSGAKALDRALNEQLKAICGFTSHPFHHAVGTHLLRRGCDLRFIQLILRDQLDLFHPRKEEWDMQSLSSHLGAYIDGLKCRTLSQSFIKVEEIVLRAFVDFWGDRDFRSSKRKDLYDYVLYSRAGRASKVHRRSLALSTAMLSRPSAMSIGFTAAAFCFQTRQMALNSSRLIGPGPAASPHKRRYRRSSTTSTPNENGRSSSSCTPRASVLPRPSPSNSRTSSSMSGSSSSATPALPTSSRTGPLSATSRSSS